jgi:hypothetical protein
MFPQAAGWIPLPLEASSEKLLTSTFSVVKPQTSPIFFQLASLGPMMGSKFYSQTLHCSPQQWLFTKADRFLSIHKLSADIISVQSSSYTRATGLWQWWNTNTFSKFKKEDQVWSKNRFFPKPIITFIGKKGEVHLCTGTEALYRLYGP